jgi:hypothetical protein
MHQPARETVGGPRAGRDVSVPTSFTEGRHAAPLTRRRGVISVMALPVPVNAFRLPGPDGAPPWLGDDMGGGLGPGDPRLTRREMLVRAAIAATALAVGGGVNVLTTTLARLSLESRGGEPGAGERR